jgi:hypothetical protein
MSQRPDREAGPTMRIEAGDLSVDCAAPIAGYLLIYVALAGLGFYVGHWLMQPSVIPNAGLAAYEPPPATRLIPLPRKMDAPELADLPPAPVETVSDQPERPSENVEKTTVAATPKPAARRPKARQHDDPMSAYAYTDRWGQSQRWGYGQRVGYGERWDRSWSSWRGGWNNRW